MRSSKQMQGAIDNRFKRLFSEDFFSQYLKLSPANQKELRKQFKEIFMTDTVVDQPKDSISFVSRVELKSSKQA